MDLAYGALLYQFSLIYNELYSFQNGGQCQRAINLETFSFSVFVVTSALSKLGGSPAQDKFLGEGLDKLLGLPRISTQSRLERVSPQMTHTVITQRCIYAVVP